MKLLALDCSTELCSVALYENTGDAQAGAGRVVAEETAVAAREHTRRLLPMVESILAATGLGLSDLDAIAFGRGPGSFTGLRIALGAVQGLAFGADLPVVPVSTLAALAQTAVDSGLVESPTQTVLFSALDARMDEIYWALYQSNGRLVAPLGPECLSSPEGLTRELLDVTARAVGVGSGWRYGDQIPATAGVQQLFPGCQPTAGALARLADGEFRAGGAVSAQRALPSYLRDEVAWQKASPSL